MENKPNRLIFFFPILYLLGIIYNISIHNIGYVIIWSILLVINVSYLVYFSKKIRK
ncbi:MAG: hypothetical protein Q4A87_07445 [Streptococcus sp.]|nr:hypothetical protein [Streptococcus sp.]